ncbi:MAG: hypothetical protein KDG50_01425 [Chromatiales bacterium]|nr:hypothetical protein [Chromatiales bacterium]
MTKILFVIVLVAIVAFALWHQSRHRDALAGAASALGLPFERGEQALPATVASAGFHLFTQGDARISNRMYGRRDGHEIEVFEYGYLAALGQEGEPGEPSRKVDDANIRDRRQTVIWIRTPGQRLADFDIAPADSAIRSVTERTGLQLVTLDDAQDFNAAFRVHARDADRIRALLTPELRESLMQRPRRVIESRGDAVLIFAPEVVLDPDRLNSAINDSLSTVSGFQRPAN